MFKKIIATLSCALFLSACGSTNSHKKITPIYQISDADALKALEQEIPIWQCLFPDYKTKMANNSVQISTGLPYDIFSKLSHSQSTIVKNIKANILAEVIGSNNAARMTSDSDSLSYYSGKILRLQKSVFKKSPSLSAHKCNNFKQEFQLAVATLDREKANQQAARQAQLAKEEQARQTFYATPEGQAYLAQQRLLQQQQAMQYQQQQMFEQQRMQQERQARQQAWQDLGNTIQQSAQTLTNTLNQNTQMINNMNNQMMRNNQQMMQNWGNRGGSINCYNLGSITRCNY